MATANPSVDELLVLDGLVNGDVGAALDEVVLRLGTLLPGLIAAKNSARGWSGAAAMRVPSFIGIGPADVTAAFNNMVLVTVDEESSAQGIGGAFRNRWNLQITSIDDYVATPQQARVCLARGEAIKTCLFAFLSGCVGADGVLRWKVAEPGTMSLKNDLAENISLVSVVFTLIQPPLGG